MAAPTPDWVIRKVREYAERATPVSVIAELVTAAGFQCTPRQVRRWKEKHRIRWVWGGTDAELDQVVQQLRDDGELGAQASVCQCDALNVRLNIAE